ncbi:MAG: AAA family ATPase, partial [Deinococcus-Thermus bacterium]|nr:AAA family ATPase [Deinococcota bacterium]
MPTPSLTVQHLTVEQMYGRRQPPLTVDDLAAGVNIIYGPNATGKTTLARALQAVFWPDQVPYDPKEIHAAFHLDGQTWHAEVTARGRTLRRGGTEASPPPLPTPDQRPFYWLSLHELLRATADDGDVAARILRQATGGLSVVDAAAPLGFKEVWPRSGTPTRDAEAARETLDERRTRHRRLAREQRRVTELEQQLQEARDAEARLRVLEQALAVAEQRAAWDAARTRRDAYPDVLRRVQGDERETLADERAVRHEAQNDRQAAEKAAAEAREQIAASPLPEEGVTEETVESLHAAADRLEQAEARREDAATQLQKAEAAADHEWQHLKDVIDRDRARTLTPPDVQQLASLARQANDLHARAAAFDRLHDLLGTATSTGDPDAVRDGLLQLRGWLQATASASGAATTSRRPRLLVGLGAAGTLVLTVVLAITTTQFVLTAALAVIAVLLLVAAVLLYRQQQSGGTSADDAGAPYRSHYARLPLAPPARWDEAHVLDRLDALAQQLGALQVEARKAEAWTQTEDRRTALAEEQDAFAARRQQVYDALGASADLEAEALWHFVETLVRWQKAHADAVAHRAALADADDAVTETRDAVNAGLQTCGFAPVETYAEAARRLRRLETARQELREARRALEDAEARAAETETTIAARTEAIDALFARLDLEPGDEDGLRALLDQHAAYQEAQAACTEAKIRMETEREKLEAMPAFDEALLDRTADALRAEIETVRAQAAEKETLQTQITEIRTKVDAAKQGHGVEEARADYDAAIEALRRQREADYRAVIGWRLAQHLHEQTRDQALPPVFHRARTLFGTFTQQRYRLDMDHDADRPGFCAYDHEQGALLDLSALSSGTRIQLLLAVRIAFLEAQEQGVRLPLLLDETLANSDDQKAAAIIDAIRTISTERQVFYLTAQGDEVAKWRAAFAEHDAADCRIHTLSPSVTPAPTVRPDVTVPEPAPAPAPDLSHAAYGQQLGVPAWDPFHSVDTLHVWHLIEDTAVLNDVLRHGLRTWGALKQFAEQARPSAAGLSPDAYRRLQQQ